MEIRRCKVCGKEFQPVNWRQIYCGKECNIVANKRIQKERYRKEKTHRRGGLTIAEIALMARAEGLTYGQYVAKYRI